MSHWRSIHIATGTLSVNKDDSRLSATIWDGLGQRIWYTFTHKDDSTDENELPLPAELQSLIFSAPGLKQLGSLFRKRWLKLELMVPSGAHFLIRVYLLPDDVLRGTVDRTVASCRKDRAALLSRLDFSQAAWKGLCCSSNDHNTVTAEAIGTEDVQSTSLLQIFNTIPSPQPTPEDVQDLFSREAISDLLESNVWGLTTELYLYQRRSAALMLQKEAQPGHNLDPRLQRRLDQNGKSVYFDHVGGTILSEPRYYDGIAGGILAEEMGAGKTVICLALILASRAIPTKVPEIYGTAPPPVRPRPTSLMDMAASCATQHAIPWRSYLDAYGAQGFDYSRCIGAIKRNPGFYLIPPPEPRRGGRHPSYEVELPAPKKIYLTSATLIVVPTNLVAQWRQEINKHTDELNVLVITKKDGVPSHKMLLDYDIILFSQSRFEAYVQSEHVSDHGGHFLATSTLGRLHFKRCIIDEGHKLGNSKLRSRSNLLLGLDSLHFESRWVVTGTPSHGLYGVDTTKVTPNGGTDTVSDDTSPGQPHMERKDLERIGSMASLFLKARPWANSILETGDTTADWDAYVMLPRHKKGSRGRWDTLKTALNSLILRHRLDEVSDMLPPVEEKVVLLDGSYQDRLSTNIFSMMIIFNAIQSQRTDQDYFFHPKQRKALLQIVHNLKQASFFGGSFFTTSEIAKAVETAEEFLEKKDIPVSQDDEALLREAINFGHLAMRNSLRDLSNQFHEMPVMVESFPGAAGRSWSLSATDGGSKEGGICTSASLLLSLQKLIYDTAGEPEKFNALLNGGLLQEGINEKQKLIEALDPSGNISEARVSQPRRTQTLAGNTKLGGDSPHKSRFHGVNGAKPITNLADVAFSAPLESTKITATVSAKLSYLVDQVVKFQEDEKIIIFYENENIAFYLASMLDVVSLSGRTRFW